MDFAAVLFLAIVGCATLGAVATAVRHLIRRGKPDDHHNRREDAWYWTSKKRKGAGAGR